MSRKRSRELFPTDDPIPAERMIGRQEDVAGLTGALSNGLHRIVAGPRRVGKTSVCVAAVQRLRASGHYTVGVDLFRVPDAAALADLLVAQTVANRPALHRAALRVREAGRAALRAATLNLVVRAQDELGEELAMAFEPGLAARDPARYLDYALTLPARLAAADDRRLILFIDEFQELATPRQPYGNADALTKRMRATMQGAQHVTCLFAGSVEHLMRDLFSDQQRAFYRFGGFHELGQITAPEWHAGISARLAEDDCTLDGDGAQRIVELGGLHPRATMLIAQQAHVASVEQDTHTIDATLVQIGYRAALAADRPGHESTVARMRSTKHALALATRIAAGQPPYRGLDPKSAQRAIGALADAAILNRDTDGAWQITDPLLAQYLRTNIAS